MFHLSDVEDWRHFDMMHPTFAEEPCNVRLGLCTDEFASHWQYSGTSSCSPIILTPYNLPWFSDGYASNIARCVNMMELTLHGMKSHDSHVLMLSLIPIAFCEMLPEHVWSALMEVSLLFQSICSTTLNVTKLYELEYSVAVIMCNLEKIFSPAFFD
ncbi:hypothetical protein Sango_1163100 [Sesamum angolense]|uniref:Uncharacterized protein n=1 Tax=Sesamum angolense TaxID=2727404 RepID=A0AAE1WVU7_9LAMI|nr:hypothetical protein Sango_1163100 [Sesamum angolense]